MVVLRTMLSATTGTIDTGSVTEGGDFNKSSENNCISFIIGIL